jgi:hypothetical protein
MQSNANHHSAKPPGRARPEEPFAANEVGLSPRQWLAALVMLAALCYLIPVFWERIEPLPPEPDYRLPYRLGNDYWVFSRTCRRACFGDQTLVLGDSVVWGHYVDSRQTLSHYLNDLAGRQQYANLGVDGIHPVALSGLVEYYGGDLRAKDVILHCNLLWMSSPRADLQEESEADFNHPELVPQFLPRIPCYREPISRRLGIAVGRNLTFFGWASHLRIAYFEDEPEYRRWTDFRTWIIAHPYDNPAGAVALELPSPDEPPVPQPVVEPWNRRPGSVPRSFPWVELETSLQWRFFQRTVETLRARGNRVFVLVGPFNEHMLTPESLKVYRSRLRVVEAWLQENQVAYYVAAALPSQEYADASHPLAEGYRRLAGQLFENPAFADFRGPTTGKRDD